MPALFPGGLRSPEWDEAGPAGEANTVASEAGERLPLVTPLRTREAKGCTEKWLAQVKGRAGTVDLTPTPTLFQLDFLLRSSVRQTLLAGIEALSAPSAAPKQVAEIWATWPVQAATVASFVLATRLVRNG